MGQPNPWTTLWLPLWSEFKLSKLLPPFNRDISLTGNSGDELEWSKDSECSQSFDVEHLTDGEVRQKNAHDTETARCKSAFSFLRQLQTWHCPHLLLGVVLRPRAAAAPATQQQTRQTLLQGANGTDRQTNGRTLYRYVDPILYRQYQQNALGGANYDKTLYIHVRSKLTEDLLFNYF